MTHGNSAEHCDYEYENGQSRGIVRGILAVFGALAALICYMFSVNKPSAQELRSTNELHDRDMSVLMSFGMVTIFLILTLGVLIIDITRSIICCMFPVFAENIRNSQAKEDYYECL